MSKVEIKGAVAGTGKITLEAPDTNSNFTVTLPNSTGTLFTTGVTSGLNANAITLGVLAVAQGGTGSNTASFSGANITSLNASAIASGTVPTARLGSGTADSTTYLRGDQTWQTISTTPTTSQVLNATAGLTAGDIGSYAMMKSDNTATMSPGSTRAGSALYWANAGNGRFGNTRPSGTWRVLGCLFYDIDGNGSGSDSFSTSVFVRIS